MDFQKNRKLDNTFHFKRFLEQLHEVNITSLTRKEFTNVENENSSSFGESLRKWRELNCTQQFVEFLSKLQGDVDSLLLVIHNQKTIVECLKSHLLIGDSLTLEPLIDLTVQLGRDLQDDFYENYFACFFDIFVTILGKHHHNVKVIQSIFVAFSFFFKSLQRKFLDNIEDTFNLFCPLLNECRHKTHINQFAAEAFAFLMRKYSYEQICKESETKNLFTFVMRAAINDKELKFGISKLLFEMVKGMKFQFYSQTPMILSSLLGLLDDEEFNGEVTGEILEELWRLMCIHTNAEYSSIMVDCTVQRLSDVHLLATDSGTDIRKIKILMKLVLIIVRHKRACLIKNEAYFIGIIEKLFIKTKGIEILLDIVSAILISDLPSHHRPTLLTLAYNSNFSFETILSFTNDILKISLFEKDALIYLMKYCQNIIKTQPGNVLHVLTVFIVKKYNSTICNRDVYMKYLPELSGYVSSIVCLKRDFEIISNPDMFALWAAYLCLPFIKLPSIGNLRKPMERHIVEMIKSAKCTSLVVHRKRLLCMVKQAIKAFICIFEDDLNFINEVLLTTLVNDFYENEEALSIVIMCLEEIPHFINDNLALFYTWNALLQDNLLSPYSELRTLSLKILSWFKFEILKDSNHEMDNIFKVCLEAENTLASLPTFRHKLNCLQKLSCDVVGNRLPVRCSEIIPLKYLISQLYINFQLLWDPVKNLIAGYAESLDSDVFWDVFGKQIELAGKKSMGEHIQNDIIENLMDDDSKLSMEHLFNRDCFGSYEIKKLDRPNVMSFRENLWSCMLNFPGKCQLVSGRLVHIFFQFLEEEYRYKWDNVKYRSKAAFQEESSYSKIPDRCLILHLKLFAAFKEPNKIDDKQKLFDLYMELIQTNSFEVQKVAFSCLLTYNLPYLNPYKENFERLLDEKSFKDELVVFTFEEEKCIVNPVHRPKIVPLILRILLGKMRMKIGKDANGRTLGHARTNTILTYLASFNNNEISMLLDLLFAPVLHLTTSDIEAITSGNMVLDIPLKKQQRIVTNIELIFNKLGHKMDDYLLKTLNILLCIGASCNHHLIQKRDLLVGTVVNHLKNIRSSVYNLAVKFFEIFTSFKFETSHMEAIFHAVVWPQLKKLPLDTMNNPTNLLRLLLCWSKYPRFHILLAKTYPSEPDITPFSVVLEILKETKIDSIVAGMVFEIIDNLLIIEEMEDDWSMIDPGAIFNISAFANIGMTFGTSLVVTFCMQVLHCIEKSLTSYGHAGKKEISNLSQQLSILSKLSCYVTDAASSEKLCEQLILIMSKGCKVSTENELKIFISVKNLISKVTNVLKLTGTLSSLFEKISNPVSRTELSLIVQEIGYKDDQYQIISEIIVGLNAIDRSRLDEPDYVTRMAALSKTSDYLNKRFSLKNDDDLKLLIQNFFFILIHSPSRAFRERTLTCMEEIIRLCIKNEAGQYFVDQNIIPLLKKYLKINSEDSRHCMIKLLKMIVVHHKTNMHFVNLVTLCNFDDEEKDFFLNITHIQMHRRARALRKLSQFFDSDLNAKLIPDKAITYYLLPLIIGFLKDQLYSKDLDLLNASIEALSSISVFLPWKTYFRLLKDYLKILTKTPPNQKLIVRIIVALVDSFHFNLNDSQYSSHPYPDEVVEEEMDLHTDNETKGNDEICVIKDVGCATRIHKMMMKHILPNLNKCLTHKAKSDDQHKLIREKYAEDEEILRVPIALAMIKLLQKLPHGSLDTNLNGIVLKLCYFLGSRAEDIRNIARDTIKKAVISLGAHYLLHFVTAMKSHLTRGYQVHVLCFTIWAILEEVNLKAKEEGEKFEMKPGDIDGCIPFLNEIFHKELFSDVAEEKEVDAISRKLFEAKMTKSYDSYRLLCKWMSIEQLPKLIKPLKEVLDQTNSHKVISKISNCLSKISQGLIENKSLSIKFVLTFVHGLTSDTLLHFVNQTIQTEAVGNRNDRPKLVNCLILEAAPPRIGLKAKKDVKTNLYVLIEFGLNTLHQMLKHSLLDMKHKDHLKLLDPFVSVLEKLLDSKHTVVCVSSLKCLIKLLRFPLPSIPIHVKKISNKMFLLIKTYSTIGAGKNEHSEMIDWCFKALQVLVQFVTCHNISEQQLHTLLMYAERDLHDYSKHATAFPLLHAILCRKLNAPELTQIMATVEEMSIKSEMPDVQNKCRKALLTYLIDYPLDYEAMENHIKFLVRQLEYEYEMGRMSAMQTLNSILKVFPQNILNNYSTLMFLQLAQSRLNDDSFKCIEMASMNIKLLLQKVSTEERDRLRTLVFEWMDNPKSNVLMLMTMVLSIFVEVEANDFKKHLKVVLSKLSKLIHPEMFQRDIISDSEQLEKDRLLFCFLDLLLVTLKHCNVVRDHSYAEVLATIWDHIMTLCKYEYEPVRVKSSQLFGLLLTSWTSKEIISHSLVSDKNLNYKAIDFLQFEFIKKLHKLLGTFTFQLSADVSMELANEVCGNLLLLLDILLELPENLNNTESTKVSIHWLIKKMCKETMFEVINNRQSTIKRNTIFVWLRAAAEKLGPNRICKHLKEMIRPLIREILDNSPTADAILKTLAQEVLDYFKNIAGIDVFTQSYAEVNKTISSKKIAVKATKSVQVTTNPELFAKKKIKKNLAKREAKKRKLDEKKPYRSKKRRLEGDVSFH